MADTKDTRPHIFLGATGKAEQYTATTGGGGGAEIPARNRQQHGAALRQQLDTIAAFQSGISEESKGYELESRVGIQVSFESFPGVELMIESLADARQQIELMNVHQTKNQTLATVFVPEGKLTVFEEKLQAYLEEKKDINGKPRDNRKLIDSIQSFRLAAVEAMWTDDPSQWPSNSDEIIWWEVWLPVRDDRKAVLNDFTMLAQGAGIDVSPFKLEFPERTIAQVKGTRNQLAQSGLLLNTISELRRAKETALFFDDLPPEQQAGWSSELLSRLQVFDENTPYICILDTGVNSGHPLLQPFIRVVDQHVVEPEWDSADDNGHGTGMAGLAVWGDLVEPLESTNIVQIGHRLESVKLLRHPGDNEGKHLGFITSVGVALPEILEPTRQRIYAMALSASDGRDRGRPSAWSSEIDSLVSDFLGENANPRLFVACAGNTGDDLTALMGYPDYNLTQDVHDPGQAWNALTIGAYTQKTTITEPVVDVEPLAPAGGLSPYSSTSATWSNSSPIKPEVVFEGAILE